MNDNEDNAIESGIALTNIEKSDSLSREIIHNDKGELDSIEKTGEEITEEIVDFDGLQLRDDFNEESMVDSPGKHDQFGESINFGESLDIIPTHMRTLDSTSMSNTQTTMVMEEDSEDDLRNMPNSGEFTRYSMLNSTLEWFKQYIFETPIKFKYNMHGVPL